jgi:hypothetical protein
VADIAWHDPKVCPVTPPTARTPTIPRPDGVPAEVHSALVAEIAADLHLDPTEVAALIGQATTLGWTLVQLRGLLAEIRTNTRSGAPAVVFRTRIRVKSFPKGA